MLQGLVIEEHLFTLRRIFWVPAERHLLNVAAVTVLAFTIGACTREPSATATHDEAMFRGRVVRIVVGVGPGGGQDLYARLTAAHLTRHLPGAPAIVVENMPGAGGLVAAQYLARRAAADGLTIGMVSMAPVLQQLADTESASHVDVRTFHLIGSPADDAPVCLFSRAGGFNLDAWRNGRVPRMGTTGAHSGTTVNTLLLAEALGLKVRPIRGYQGTADIRLALHNGEVDGVCTEWSSYHSTFTPADEYTPALYAGSDNTGPMNNVPRAAALVTTASGRELLSVVAALGTLARFFALPPGATPQQVDIWRRAFDATMADGEFQAAAAAARLAVRPRSADDVARHIHELLTLPPERRRHLIALLRPTES